MFAKKVTILYVEYKYNQWDIEKKTKGWLNFGERVIFIANGRKRGGPQEGQFLKGWSPLQRGKILIVNKCCAQWSSDQYFLVVSCNCWFDLDCM